MPPLKDRLTKFRPTRSGGAPGTGTDAFGAARRIYQDLADTVSQACFEGDFDAYAACFALPHVMASPGERQILESPQDVRRVFDGFRAYMQQHGVTTYLRVCLEARFSDPGTIIGTHESHILRGEDYLQPRFPVRTRLVHRDDGRWVSVESEATVSPDAEIPDLIRPVPPAPPDTGGDC